MISYAAQEYVSRMLAVYLKDGTTTTFRTSEIGTDPFIWKELERAGIVKLFPRFGTVEFDPYANEEFYPDDAPE